MAGEFKGLTVKFRGDATDLTAALHTINTETGAAKRNARDFQKALKFDSTNVDAIKGALGETTEQLRAANERADALRQALNETDDPNAHRRLQAALEATETDVKRLHAEVLELNASLAVQTTPMGKLATGLQSAGTMMQTVGAGMSSVGDTLTTHVSAPMIAAATASVTAAVDIDTALTGVRKTVDATEGEYEALKDAAIEYSRNNAVSATDVLNAEALGGQLGVAKDNLAQFATVVTGLDLSTNLGLEDAAVNLAQFANLTNMSKLDAADLALAYQSYGNTIVELGNNLATTESDISAMAQNIASSGTAAGMSEADILGISGALASLGMEAQSGGSAISKTLTEISTAVATGSDDLGKYAQVAGMTAEDFAAAWKDDATGTFLEFVNGMANGSDDLNVTLDELGITELRQSDAMRRLAGNTDLLQNSVKMANEEWANGSALSDEVTSKNESVASKFEIVKNRVTALANEVGEPLVDSLKELIDLAEPLVQKVEGMAKAFNNMSDYEQKTIIKHAAYVAAAGPVLSVVGRITSGVGGLATGMGKGLEAAVKFTSAIQNGGTGMEAFATAAGLGADKAGALVTTLKNIGVVAGIALVAATIKVIADESAAAEQKERDFADATKLLRDSTSELSPKLDGTAESISEVGDNAGDAWINVDKLATAQAEMAREFAEGDKETQTSISRLEGAKQVIDEYAGKTGLTTVEQGKLKDAVQLLNDTCGTQYEVVDAANGVIKQQGDDAEVTKDKLMDLIDAQQQQIRVEALSDQLTKAYKQQADDIEAVANKTRYLKEVEENASKQRADLKKQFEDGSITLSEYQAKMAGVDGYVANANDDLQKSKDLLAADNDAIDSLNQQLGATEAAASGSSKSIADLAGASVEVTTALANNQSIDDFAKTLEDAGMSMDDFKNLSSDQLIELAANYDGTFESIAQTIIDSDIGGKARKKAEEVTGAVESETPNTKKAADEQAKAAASAGEFDASKEATKNAKGLPDALKSQFGPTDTNAKALAKAAGGMGNIGNQRQAGLTAATQLGSGIRAGNGPVSSAAGVIAKSAKSMAAISGLYSSGFDLAANFAAGIKAAKSVVSESASVVAAAVNAILKHSVPKEGPLREHGRGEVVYGEHLVENFAQGMLRKRSEVEVAARQVAMAARTGLTSVDDVYNPTITVVPSEIEMQTKALASMLASDGSIVDGKPKVEITINGVSGPEEAASAMLNALVLAGLS